MVVPRVVRGSYCGRDEKLPNNKLFRWCVISPAKSPWSVMAMSSRGLLQALLVAGAAIASSSFVGVATPTPRLSRHARASSRAVRMMAYKVPQHGQSPRSAVPELGSCASSGRAWRLWAARHFAWRPSPWAPSHCLWCSSEPPPKPPMSPPLTTQVPEATQEEWVKRHVKRPVWPACAALCSG